MLLHQQLPRVKIERHQAAIAQVPLVVTAIIKANPLGSKGLPDFKQGRYRMAAD